MLRAIQNTVSSMGVGGGVTMLLVFSPLDELFVFVVLIPGIRYLLKLSKETHNE